MTSEKILTVFFTILFVATSFIRDTASKQKLTEIVTAIAPRSLSAAIAASIKEWGWTSPALVGEDGGLIAGHARILAARQLGIAKIPVMVAAGWTEAQKRAYVLADNSTLSAGHGL